MVLTITTSGELEAKPSFTVNCTAYRPRTSGTNAGATEDELLNTATRPAGRDTQLQANRSRSPSASDDAEPSRVTVAPTAAAWPRPALASGREFLELMNTVAGTLSTNPSFTTRPIT